MSLTLIEFTFYKAKAVNPLATPPMVCGSKLTLEFNVARVTLSFCMCLFYCSYFQGSPNKQIKWDF